MRSIHQEVLAELRDLVENGGFEKLRVTTYEYEPKPAEKSAETKKAKQNPESAARGTEQRAQFNTPAH